MSNHSLSVLSDCNNANSISMPDFVKVKYFNARSVRNKLLSLHAVMYCENFQSICITETWLDSSVTDGIIDPRGLFNIYRCDRAADSHGGGVCILVRRIFKSSAIDIDHTMFPNVEIVACSIFLADFKRTLICCYFPPSLSSSQFLSFTNCLRALCVVDVSCFLIGDFNLPNIDWKNFVFPEDLKSKAFFNFFTDVGLNQLITEPTRGQNVLDLLLTNDPLSVSDCCVSVPFDSSDHESIEFSACFISARTAEVIPSYNFLWNKADWNSFATLLINTDWSSLFALLTRRNVGSPLPMR